MSWAGAELAALVTNGFISSSNIKVLLGAKLQNKLHARAIGKQQNCF